MMGGWARIEKEVGRWTAHGACMAHGSHKVGKIGIGSRVESLRVEDGVDGQAQARRNIRIGTCDGGGAAAVRCGARPEGTTRRNI